MKLCVKSSYPNRIIYLLTCLVRYIKDQAVCRARYLNHSENNINKYHYDRLKLDSLN